VADHPLQTPEMTTNAIWKYGVSDFVISVASKMIQTVLITYFLVFNSKMKNSHMRNFLGNIWKH
jgi:hypothetical protein